MFTRTSKCRPHVFYVGVFLRNLLVFIFGATWVLTAFDVAGAFGTEGIRDTVYTTPPIVVTAPARDPQLSAFKQPGFVARIRVGERHNRVSTLASLLSMAVGVRVKQYGGLGGFATVSIRASAASHVNVLLDGLPINDPYTGASNLADFALGGLERVDVYRGFTPGSLGGGAIGGTINLITATPTDASEWRLHFDIAESAGSFGTTRHKASAWSKGKHLSLFGHMTRLRSDGNFDFFDDNDTPFNTGDDATTQRLNNDLSRFNGLAKATVSFDGLGSSSVMFEGQRSEVGIPGRGANQSVTAGSKRSHRLSRLSIDPIPLLSKRLFTALTGHYMESNERFSDIDARVGLIGTETNNTITRYGGGARAKLFLPMVPLSIEAKFDSGKERFHPETVFPEPRERTRQASRLARHDSDSRSICLRPHVGVFSYATVGTARKSILRCAAISLVTTNSSGKNRARNQVTERRRPLATDKVRDPKGQPGPLPPPTYVSRIVW